MRLHKIKLFAVFLFGAILITGAAIRSYAQDSSGQISMWLQAASQGDTEAEMNLGNSYSEGWGVRKDEAEAAKWYRRAAEKGVAGAQFSLGQIYFAGLGVVQDYKEALEWYGKAADQGDSAAQNSLGDAYFLGTGVAKDIKTAISWYQKAAEEGNPDAQYKLGEAYRTGEGVQKDEEEAVSWYQKAAEQRNAPAVSRLADIEAQRQKAELLHVRNIPPAVLIAIVIATITALVSFIMEMKRDGAEQYELKFYDSLQFGLLMSGSIVFYTMDVFLGISLAQWASVATLAVALVLNIRQSNASFGPLYTLAQAIVAYTVFLILLVEIFKKSNKPAAR
jgi:TPR repeat protein